MILGIINQINLWYKKRVSKRMVNKFDSQNVLEIFYRLPFIFKTFYWPHNNNIKVLPKRLLVKLDSSIT